VRQLQALNEIAVARDQSLAQMAIAWLLKDPRITSVLVGVRTMDQMKDNLHALRNTTFSDGEWREIRTLLQQVP
jgi:L-glyceraldehyde 3-phosphate reductase